MVTAFLFRRKHNYVNIFISHPIGTDIKITNETTIKVEKDINKILEKYINKDTEAGIPKNEQIIKSIISQVGEGTSDPAQGVTMGNTPHKGRITVNFVESQFRKGVNTSDILRKIQSKLKGQFTADIEITAAKDAQGPPQGAPINIEVIGKVDYRELISEAQKLKSFLDKKSVEGVEQLKLNVEANRPEIPIRVDRDQIRKLNASTAQVGMSIRKALLGEDVSTYTVDEETYDIVVKFDKQNRESLDALLDQRLIFRNNKGQLMNIPIRSVVQNPDEVASYTAVVRKDQRPLVTLTSNVTEGMNADAVVQNLKTYLPEYEKANTVNK